MTAPPQVTYETFAAGEQDARAFREALESLTGRLGEQHPFYLDGVAHTGDGWVEERSPGDSRVLVGRFATASIDDFDRAVAVARGFAPSGRQPIGASGCGSSGASRPRSPSVATSSRRSSPTRSASRCWRRWERSTSAWC